MSKLAPSLGRPWAAISLTCSSRRAAGAWSTHCTKMGADGAKMRACNGLKVEYTGEKLETIARIHRKEIEKWLQWARWARRERKEEG